MGFVLKRKKYTFKTQINVVRIVRSHPYIYIYILLAVFLPLLKYLKRERFRALLFLSAIFMPSLNVPSSLTSSISRRLHLNYIAFAVVFISISFCSNRRTIRAYCCLTHGRCSCSSLVGDPPSKINSRLICLVSHCSSPPPPAASFMRRPMFSNVEAVT